MVASFTVHSKYFSPPSFVHRASEKLRSQRHPGLCSSLSNVFLPPSPVGQFSDMVAFLYSKNDVCLDSFQAFILLGFSEFGIDFRKFPVHPVLKGAFVLFSLFFYTSHDIFCFFLVSEVYVEISPCLEILPLAVSSLEDIFPLCEESVRVFSPQFFLFLLP